MTYITHLVGLNYFSALGDSKSASASGCWQYPLISLLEGRTSQNWQTNLTHATAGWTVNDLESGLAAALAGVATTPAYCFLDVGTNETLAMPLQASFEADYGSVLDQLHVKWPTAGIYVAKIWRGAQVANSATINGYIDNVLASRVWATVAFSEADWLDAWSLDDVHPDSRVGGYTEMARQWFVALNL